MLLTYRNLEEAFRRGRGLAKRLKTLTARVVHVTIDQSSASSPQNRLATETAFIHDSLSDGGKEVNYPGLMGSRVFKKNKNRTRQSSFGLHLVTSRFCRVILTPIDSPDLDYHSDIDFIISFVEKHYRVGSQSLGMVLAIPVVVFDTLKDGQWSGVQWQRLQAWHDSSVSSKWQLELCIFCPA